MLFVWLISSRSKNNKLEQTNANGQIDFRDLSGIAAALRNVGISLDYLSVDLYILAAKIQRYGYFNDADVNTWVNGLEMLANALVQLNIAYGELRGLSRLVPNVLAALTAVDNGLQDVAAAVLNSVVATRQGNIRCNVGTALPQVLINIETQLQQINVELVTVN